MSSRSTIDRVLRAHEDGSYFARLHNQPSPHPRRRTPELVFHAALQAVDPRLTVVTPAFNAGPMIADCITAAAQAATLPFAWILIDDGSEDDTVERARAAVEAATLPRLVRASILRNPLPIFETACDNLGFALAEKEVIVEMQSDIQIREPGFDALALAALALPQRPSAVSGRCGHSFFVLRGRVARLLLGGTRDECVGLCGPLIDTPEVVNGLKGRIYQCETVPRGPWIVRKADLERVGYLDERFFFLGNDDHDYHRRLFEADGRRPVYVPMALHSPLHLGAVRRTRTGLNRALFAELKSGKRGSPAFQRFLARSRPAIPERLV